MDKSSQSHPSRKDKDAARVGHPRVDESPMSQNRGMGHPRLWLVTGATVADQAEKQRLAATFQAALVDMEAAAIAHLAAARAIPFFCVKGISDGYSDQLPEFNRFISPDGRFQLARFVVFALRHPSCWPALIRMGENSKKAARAIAVLRDFTADTQFLIITHNKGTMEAADVLYGVTMAQLGVSSLISMKLEATSKNPEPVAA